MYPFVSSVVKQFGPGNLSHRPFETRVFWEYFFWNLFPLLFPQQGERLLFPCDITWFWMAIMPEHILFFPQMMLCNFFDTGKRVGLPTSSQMIFSPVNWIWFSSHAIRRKPTTPHRCVACLPAAGPWHRQPRAPEPTLLTEFEVACAVRGAGGSGPRREGGGIFGAL